MAAPSSWASTTSSSPSVRFPASLDLLLTLYPSLFLYLMIGLGFGKGAQREYAVWDPKKLSEPLLPYVSVDNSAGVIAPFYDEDSDLIFLAGKGTAPFACPLPLIADCLLTVLP